MVAGFGSKQSSSSSIPDQKFTAIVLYATLLSATGCLLFGYDTGITSGSMIFIKEQFKMSSFWQELTISITLITAAVSSAFSGHVSTHYGRKFVILSASAIFTIGSVVMATASDKYQLLIGRLIVGGGIGFAATNVPTYIAEVAPIKYRGSLLALAFVFIVLGQLIAAIIAGLFTFLPEDISWRYMLGIAGIPAAIQFLGFLFMPESPRWLIQTGRNEEAVVVLKRLRATDQVMAEFLKIKQECEAGRADESFRMAWQDPVCRKSLLVISVLWATHELSGINTLMYYTATMVQMAGVYDKSQAVWYSAAVSTFYVAFSATGIYLVETIGRRKLLLISITGVVFSLLLIGAGFKTNELTGPSTNQSDVRQGICQEYSTCGHCTMAQGCGFCFSPDHTFPGFCLATSGGDTSAIRSRDGFCANGTVIHGDIWNGTATVHGKTVVWAKDWCPSPYSYIVLIGMTLFLISFGPGLGAMAHTITAEIFPLKFRAAGTSYVFTLNWSLNALVSLTFLTMTETIGKPATFWTYSVITIAGGIVLFFTIPETKGTSLEDTADLFQSVSTVA